MATMPFLVRFLRWKRKEMQNCVEEFKQKKKEYQNDSPTFTFIYFNDC